MSKKKVVRIQGLVKIMNMVRERLREPLDECEQTELQEYIVATVSDVRRICEKNGCTPADLPTPSRRAFDYLADVSFQDRFSHTKKNRSAENIQLSLRGLRPSVTSFVNQLAFAKSRQDIDHFLLEANCYLDRVEAKLRKQSAKHAGLPVKQQRLLLRLREYVKEPLLSRFPQNGVLLDEYIEDNWPVTFLNKMLPELVIIPSDTRLWQLKKERGGLVLYISDLFLLSEQSSILGELGSEIIGRKRRTRKNALKMYLSSETVCDFKQRIEKQVVHNPVEGQGVYYDLNALFKENNQRYFEGTLRSSGLYWTRNRAKCRTGYYNPQNGEIYISSALDAKDVPHYVVSYVMYHEMLHMQQAMAGMIAPGKRVHTKAFKQLEKNFSKYQAAELFLRRLASSR